MRRATLLLLAASVALITGCARQANNPSATTTLVTVETVPEEDRSAVPKVVYFDYDVDSLDKPAQEALAAVGVWLEQDDAHQVVLLARPGDDGRVETARDFLLLMGFEPARVIVQRVGAQESVVADDRHLLRLEQREALLEERPPLPLPPEPEVVLMEEPARTPWSGVGISIGIGAGVTTFLDDDMMSFTSPGGAWDARVAVGTYRRLGIEAGYIGSVQPIDALGLDDDAVLLGTGLESTLRLNLIDAATRPLQPYLLGGVGWTRYEVRNTEVNTSNINDRDDHVHLPVGAGVAFRAASLVFDVRTLFRAALNDDLVPPTGTGSKADLHSWALNARAGFEF